MDWPRTPLEGGSELAARPLAGKPADRGNAASAGSGRVAASAAQAEPPLQLRAPGARHPFPAARSEEALEQLDLPGVIKIVRRDAVDVLNVAPLGAPAAPPELFGVEARDRPPQQLVLLPEQRGIAPPRRPIGALGEPGPVAAGARQRDLRVAQQAAPNHGLPIGRVEDQLPDVVTASARPPQRLVDAEAAQGAPQRRAVPGRASERLVEDFEQQADATIHRPHSGCMTTS